MFHKTWRKPGSILTCRLLRLPREASSPDAGFEPGSSRRGYALGRVLVVSFPYPRPLGLAPASRRGPTRPGADLLRCRPAVFSCILGLR